MLSAGNLRFSAVGKGKDRVLFPNVRVCVCVHAGIERIRVLYNYLMDINMEETIINTLTTLQPASPRLSRLNYSVSKGFWKC